MLQYSRNVDNARTSYVIVNYCFFLTDSLPGMLKATDLAPERDKSGLTT